MTGHESEYGLAKLHGLGQEFYKGNLAPSDSGPSKVRK